MPTSPTKRQRRVERLREKGVPKKVARKIAGKRKPRKGKSKR